MPKVVSKYLITKRRLILYVNYGQNTGTGSLGAEVEMLKSAVSKYFDIYDIRVTYETVAFFVRCSPSDLESSFDGVRTALVPRNYVPFLQKRGGEFVIVVGKRRAPGRHRNIANIALLAVTLVSTTITGAILWANYYNQANLFTPDTIINGIIFFVLPIMLILGSHEMGHFVVARHYKVNASLPYFLPSIPPLGTLGAFISIRDPFPNRKALLEIGLAGPVVGFMVSIPVAIAGFMLTQMNLVHVIVTPGSPVFKAPFLFNFMMSFFPFSSGSFIIFPTAFAAWVGFFATALNLLPAGQLDGGHIARALLGDNARYLGWGTLAVLIVLSINFTSWIFIALFVMILGVRHPPPLNDVSKLKIDRKMLGAIAAAMFLISFTPIPVTTIPAYTSFSITSATTSVTVNNTSVQKLQLTVTSTGNTGESITLSSLQSATGYTHFEMLFAQGAVPINNSGYTGSLSFTLGAGKQANVSVEIAESNPNVTPVQPGQYLLDVLGVTTNFRILYAIAVIAQ